MAFVYKSANNSGFSPASIEVAKTTETVTAKGDVMAWDRGNNALERATSSTTAADMFGVCMEIQTAADTTVIVVPFSPGQIWEADLASNSSTSETGERMELTDHDTLNNTSTEITATTGTFVQLAPVGTNTDNKALVMALGPVGVTTAS